MLRPDPSQIVCQRREIQVTAATIAMAIGRIRGTPERHFAVLRSVSANSRALLP